MRMTVLRDKPKKVRKETQKRPKTKSAGFSNSFTLDVFRDTKRYSSKYPTVKHEFPPIVSSIFLDVYSNQNIT
ncbi:MAG TPA: hypothetical protein DGG95_12825 [Cytophagales bacterium]|nr:hypothetical protein [Cytophagales bacterium]